MNIILSGNIDCEFVDILTDSVLHDQYSGRLALEGNLNVHLGLFLSGSQCFEKDIVKYIDYDLDFKVNPENDIRVLDEFEYKKHRKFFNYSQELDEVIKYNFEKVKKKIKENVFPFNSNTIEEYYKQYLK